MSAPILRERSEAEKLRYAMLKLTRLALDDDPYLRAHVLTLGTTLGFAALCDASAAAPPDSKEATK